jgi:hypothetical protein
MERRRVRSTERRRRHPAARFRPAQPAVRRRHRDKRRILPTEICLGYRKASRAIGAIIGARSLARWVAWRENVRMTRQSFGILCSVTLTSVLILSTSAPARQKVSELCNPEAAAHAAKLHANDKEKKNADCRTTQFGIASWYGGHFQHRRTASGEPFDMNELTAAHPTLPLNSHVLVTNLATGRSVVVRINDRGPYIGDRIIDLSARAASELGMKQDGIARVRIQLADASQASSAGSYTTASK